MISIIHRDSLCLQYFIYYKTWKTHTQLSGSLASTPCSSPKSTTSRLKAVQKQTARNHCFTRCLRRGTEYCKTPFGLYMVLEKGEPKKTKKKVILSYYSCCVKPQHYSPPPAITDIRKFGKKKTDWRCHCDLWFTCQPHGHHLHLHIFRQPAKF